METVSVAIASYNGGAYIAEQLASIAAQTRLPDELVVSDDGSSDDTADHVERFAATAPFPVVLLRQDRRLGILENFYAAFAASSGDLIAYCDQDDIWQPDKIACQMKEVARGAALVLHPSLVVDDRLQPIGGLQPVNSAYGLIATPANAQSIHGFGHQMMFSRAVLALMLRLRPLIAERTPAFPAGNFDQYIPFCASMIGPIALLREPHVLFRRHAAATTAAGRDGGPGDDRLNARAIVAIERDAIFFADAAAIVEEAMGQGLCRAEIGRPLARALASRARLSRLQQRIADAPSRARRLALLPGALGQAARPLGFGNDRTLHAMLLTAAVALL